MKNQFKLAIAINKGYSSIVFIYKGKCIHYKVTKSIKVGRGNPILQYMELLKDALVIAQSLVRNPEYFDEDSWEDVTFLIDIRSDALIKMLKNYHTTTNYKELFQQILNYLDNIPFVYSVSNNGAQVAISYANERYIKKDEAFEINTDFSFFDK